jgi:hypothetical protein
VYFEDGASYGHVSAGLAVIRELRELGCEMPIKIDAPQVLSRIKDFIPPFEQWCEENKLEKWDKVKRLYLPRSAAYAYHAPQVEDERTNTPLLAPEVGAAVGRLPEWVRQTQVLRGTVPSCDADLHYAGAVSASHGAVRYDSEGRDPRGVLASPE